MSVRTLSEKISNGEYSLMFSDQVDTGCSTTLTALHQGCQSLRTGESDMSVVGGANVMFNPDMFLAMSSMT